MATAKKNKRAVNLVDGRPPLYASVAELQTKIDEYFNTAPDKKSIVAGESVIEVPVFTICGLAYFLGFESRQSFYDYEKREPFSYTIKKARLRIEQMYEQNLTFNNATGSIFALKNLGWVDNSEVKHSGKIIIDFTND